MGVGLGELLRYRDLGPLAVDRGDRPVGVKGKRLTAALSLLLMNVNQRVSGDALVGACWGDAPPGDPEGTLQSHLFRLRRLLEADHERGVPFTTLVHEAGGYRLVAPPSQIDSMAFEAAAGESRDLLLADQPQRAQARCTEALALWRGRPWTPHSDEIWAVAPAARLEEIRAQLRERRIKCLLALGETEPAIVDLEVLVVEYPLRERLWAQLMLANYRLGRTEAALATFHRARSVLIDEVAVEPGPELREIQGRILAADPTLIHAQREPVGVPSPAHLVNVHLPRRRAVLVGRDRELGELHALLASEQLVNVVGPPGCGKSRLTIEAARSAADEFVDGVWHVDVTAAEDADRLIDVTASSIGLEIAEAGTTRQALQTYLRTRQVLLVLDNCSHLIGPVADLVDLMLTDAAELTVAVTSREPLGVEGERVWILSPLPVPQPPETGFAKLGLDRLATEPAIALFVQRAASVGVVIGRGDLPSVRDICVAVDGLPLAIELAAAQTQSFSLLEIVQRVSTDAASLASVGVAAETTLADTIDQSVTTLGPSQRQIHHAVSVVPGPFTAEAAAAVAGVPVNTARNAVAGLVRRSLLVPLGARDSGGVSRFSQLGPIRSQARSTASTGELAETVSRRDAWVAELTAQQPRMGRPEEADWHRRVDDDLPTLRATLQRCLVEAPTPIGAVIAARLGLYWYYRGMVVEWESWSRLATVSASAHIFDRLLAGLSLACAVGLVGRTDLGAPYVDAAEAYPADRLSHEQAIRLGEYLFAVANTSRATRDVALGRRAAAGVRRLANTTGDEMLDVLAEIGLLLGEVYTGDPVSLWARTDAAYARAVAERNDYVAWSVATVGAILGMRTRNTATGLLWSDRTIAHHVRLGAVEAAGPLTLRGGLLALAGDYFEAAKILAAARSQGRRGGMRWPRSMETWTFVSLADNNLDETQRDQAYREGSQLQLTDIDVTFDLPPEIITAPTAMLR